MHDGSLRIFLVADRCKQTQGTVVCFNEILHVFQGLQNFSNVFGLVLNQTLLVTGCNPHEIDAKCGNWTQNLTNLIARFPPFQQPPVQCQAMQGHLLNLSAWFFVHSLQQCAELCSVELAAELPWCYRKKAQLEANPRVVSRHGRHCVSIYFDFSEERCTARRERKRECTPIPLLVSLDPMHQPTPPHERKPGFFS